VPTGVKKKKRRRRRRRRRKRGRLTNGSAVPYISCLFSFRIDDG
jgi:hypothetical protein